MESFRSIPSNEDSTEFSDNKDAEAIFRIRVVTVLSMLMMVSLLAMGNQVEYLPHSDTERYLLFLNGAKHSTESSAPSPTPSLQPTNIESAAPSSTPSLQPTNIESAAPSSTPSLQPTNIESAAPSSTPSLQPTNIESAAPSSTPSLQPTNIESAAPSSTPSLQPTNIESAAPSSTPSLQPTVPGSKWVLGAEQKSCDSVCTGVGGACNLTAMLAVDDETKLRYVTTSVLGRTVTTAYGCDPGIGCGFAAFAPYAQTSGNPNSGAASWVKTNLVTCDSVPDAGLLRICCCGLTAQCLTAP